MLWYAAIAKITYQSTTETIFTLSIADEPQTSNKQEHTYIDHMALDGVTMFGTARAAHIANLKNYIWKLDFVDTQIDSDFDVNTYKAFEIIDNDTTSIRSVTGIR